jgi:serine/threonine protein kinase
MTELPTTFGKYFLTEKLATGGMAEIYLAKLIGPGGFEKQLVIKQIHPELSGQRHFVDLFVAEAKTLVTLAHGNIVPVYELGVVDDTYFIAMDYIDGPTLYRLTETMAGRDARMEPAVAAWIAGRMLEGLDYAHRKGEGVIHRDLSPRNVMLSRDGEVKLVDFGIALTAGDPGESASTDAVPTGSFPYMSPEQVRREALTGQTDLFSVGVLMWEMLAGQRLFQRADQDATLAAVLHEPIPTPSSVRPEVPAKLDEVVMRALERDRSARWATAGDMLAALNKFLYSLDVTPGPRDVAALVAKFCPSSTRRLPTHLEASHVDDTSPQSRPPASGPSTAVIPRDQQAQRRPQRHQSFATNIDLVPLLHETGEQPALPDDGAAPAPDVTTTPTPAAPSARVSRQRMQLVEEPIERDDVPPQRPDRTAPGRNFLFVAAVGVLALGAAAVWMFYKSRDRVLAEEYADASVTAPTDAGAVDGPPLLVTRVDSSVALPDADAIVKDAGVRRGDAAIAVTPRVDAAIAKSVDAGAATATLKIGADPWGEIYVDGKPMGRTPRELVVSAGRHTVEIVFPAETPPRKQTFAVDLAAGEAKPLQADFN